MSSKATKWTSPATNLGKTTVLTAITKVEVLRVDVKASTLTFRILGCRSSVGHIANRLMCLRRSRGFAREMRIELPQEGKIYGKNEITITVPASSSELLAVVPGRRVCTIIYSVKQAGPSLLNNFAIGKFFGSDVANNSDI